MTRFALKLIIFSIPFLILITLEVIIDPFNYFSEEKNPEWMAAKENISQKENMYLYKLIKYERNPSPTIILGDSRMNLLSPSMFKDINNEDVANLAIGGGTMQDAIEILKYITSRHKIKKIYWGVSFEAYNGTRLRNGATPSIEIMNSLLLYLLNRYTFSSTMLICKSLLLDQQIDLYKPPFTKEVFWQVQLDIFSKYLINYSYPVNYYNEFVKISEYCSENDIKLVFMIPPTHTDLQNKVHYYDLDNELARFKLDFESFGDVYDFNFQNVITSDRTNFNDPTHHIDSISRIIVKEISTNKILYSKFTSFSKNVHLENRSGYPLVQKDN